jgi:hypothetical protein
MKLDSGRWPVGCLQCVFLGCLQCVFLKDGEKIVGIQQPGQFRIIVPYRLDTGFSYYLVLKYWYPDAKFAEQV